MTEPEYLQLYAGIKPVKASNTLSWFLNLWMTFSVCHICRASQVRAVGPGRKPMWCLQLVTCWLLLHSSAPQGNIRI